MVLVQPRVRMPRALETPPLSYDPAHCLLYMACRYTRQKRLFDITDCIPPPPSSYERCRSEKGTVSASAPPIDQCGHEEIASFIALLPQTAVPCLTVVATKGTGVSCKSGTFSLIIYYIPLYHILVTGHPYHIRTPR